MSPPVQSSGRTSGKSKKLGTAFDRIKDCLRLDSEASARGERQRELMSLLRGLWPPTRGSRDVARHIFGEYSVRKACRLAPCLQTPALHENVSNIKYRDTPVGLSGVRGCPGAASGHSHTSHSCVLGILSTHFLPLLGEPISTPSLVP